MAGSNEERLRQTREQVPVKTENFLCNSGPVSRIFGLDRGVPIDRYYIERFLDDHKEDVTSGDAPLCFLEVGERTYSKRLAADCGEREIVLDILDHAQGEDLTDVSTLKKDHYDLFICTQTLNFIYDVRAAIAGAYYTLKTGGTMLATLAGAITPISRYDMDRWGHFWGFTDLSAKKLFAEVFGEDHVSVSIYGNAAAATAFVQGLAQEDLEDLTVLDETDEDYQVILGIACKKN